MRIVTDEVTLHLLHQSDLDVGVIEPEHVWGIIGNISINHNSQYLQILAREHGESVLIITRWRNPSAFLVFWQLHSLHYSSHTHICGLQILGDVDNFIHRRFATRVYPSQMEGGGRRG